MTFKKLASFVLVFVLILTCIVSLSGCTSNKSELEIDSYRLVKDGEEDVIIIKFHFKNETGYETCMDDEYIVGLYQNNIALDEYYGEYYADYEDSNVSQNFLDFDYKEDSRYKYIRDGREYYPELAFYLEDTQTDIEVEIESYSMFDKKVTKVINIE